MLGIIFLGLSILPSCALFSGALFFSSKYKTIHTPTFLVFGLATLYIDLHNFYRAFSVSLDHGDWGSAAMNMGWFSFLIVANTFAFGLLGGALFSLFIRFSKKQNAGSKLSAPIFIGIIVLAIVTGSLQALNYFSQSAGQKLTVKASGTLSPELVSEILSLEPSLTKDKTLITTLLQNPNCPINVLNEYAEKENVQYRTAVLKNPNLPAETIEKLAKDQNEAVRYQAVLNDKTSMQTLLELAKDPAKDVRLKAQAAVENRNKMTH